MCHKKISLKRNKCAFHLLLAGAVVVGKRVIGDLFQSDNQDKQGGSREWLWHCSPPRFPPGGARFGGPFLAWLSVGAIDMINPISGAPGVG